MDADARGYLPAVSHSLLFTKTLRRDDVPRMGRLYAGSRGWESGGRVMQLQSMDKIVSETVGQTALRCLFTVPEGMSRLIIRMKCTPLFSHGEGCANALAGLAMAQYCPWEEPFHWRTCMPVEEVVLLALEDPRGSCGNAMQRGRDQVHYLSETAASPGFPCAAILPGKWCAAVQVHSRRATLYRVMLAIEGDWIR